MRALTILLAVAVLAPACGTTKEGPPEVEQARSSVTRATAPVVAEADRAALVADNTAFALDLHRVTRGGGNAMTSPLSVSIALAMTYAGARGETESQIAQALRFTLPQPRLHPAFNELDQALASRGQQARGQDGGPFRLRVVNAAWAQRDFSFEQAYLDTLGLNYGAGVELLDFVAAHESARETINDWVAYQTEDRIRDLLEEGTVTPSTRLVLTNAVYFNAAWKEPFDPRATREGSFQMEGGGQATVPMMSLESGRLRYAEGAGWKAVELPYDGDELSMVAILPDGDLGVLEDGLDAAALSRIVDALSSRQIALTMPKFRFEQKSSLKEALETLGMPVAFSDRADFSGISATAQMAISDVIHQTFISVDEAGTEAAAATAVIVVETSVPPAPTAVRLDRPFLFLIRDLPTGAVVFMGRVVDPR